MCFCKKHSVVTNALVSSAYLTILLLLIGCSAYTKANYIEDFSSFVKGSKDNSAKYSEADWAIADKQYNEYAIVQYEKFLPELSMEEKLAIGKLKGQYTALKVKKGANELFDQAKEMFNKAEGIIDSTMKKIN